MRLKGDLYEYVATYVDDLCLGMLDPKSFTDTLQKKYNFKLKGTGPIDFHLGQSFSRNDDGEMEISAKRYVLPIAYSGWTVPDFHRCSLFARIQRLENLVTTSWLQS